ncbi:MAG TPA: flagellar basal body rod protein [Albitalea sp.]
MSSIPAIVQSGLGAAVMRLGAAAHNIANLQTPDQRRQVVLQEPLAQGGVAASVVEAVQPGADLAGDVFEQMVASYLFKANLRVLQTHDDMLGALLDEHA